MEKVEEIYILCGKMNEEIKSEEIERNNEILLDLLRVLKKDTSYEVPDKDVDLLHFCYNRFIDNIKLITTLLSRKQELARLQLIEEIVEV